MPKFAEVESNEKKTEAEEDVCDLSEADRPWPQIQYVLM